MVDFNQVKLVIWDLDETLWKGTLSEGSVAIEESNHKLVRDLTDIGIVNSICSKNDYLLVKNELQMLKLWDFFVFPSINWEAKGNRIKSIIQSMNLRSANVLFVDDNETNIAEAQYYNKGILAINARELPSLIAWVSTQEKKDIDHCRLKRYRILQEKQMDMEQESSNEDFLYKSNITVDLLSDCEKEIDRIHELIWRTNQLNYTKKRISKEELISSLNLNNVSAGYVTAKDKYGDYGIIGFYMIRNGKAEHFVFSCRTLGMGIEQYVYSQLGFPELLVEGEVAVQLNGYETAPWINCRLSGKNSKLEKYSQREARVLMKGPCDMMQIFSFIEESKKIDWEYTYTNDKGASVEQHNHTECIREAYSISQDVIQVLAEELPFGDVNMFSKRIYDPTYDVVFLSMLTDGGMGLYRNRKTGVSVAFGDYISPLTDPKNWEGYITRRLPTGGSTFSRDFLEKFSVEYEFLGRIDVQRVVDNVLFIKEHMRKSAVLVLLTGVEIPYQNNMLENYFDRHLFNKSLNHELRKLAVDDDHIKIIEFGKYVKKQSDFYNNINHFIKPVYYNVAKEMIRIISGVEGDSEGQIRSVGKMFSQLAYVKQLLYKFLKIDKFNRADE